MSTTREHRNMSLDELTEEITRVAEDAGLNLVDRMTFDEQSGRFAPAPFELAPKVYESLKGEFPGGLYVHQVEAIQSILDGSDVCIATPTASGKSLIFMASAGDSILTSPNSKVLALYPIKALIQDQVAKWKQMFDPLGISIGYIDGSVPMHDRFNILKRSSVILMTPDVMQAWLLANTKKKEVAEFLANLKQLILDEAHVYSGVFGSNMAFLLRRLQAVSNLERLITSTATIGSPGDFIERLTGRVPKVFSEADDTAPKPPRSLLLASPLGDQFKSLVAFVAELSKRDIGKIIAFGDSRRLVETFVAAAKRHKGEADVPDEEESADQDSEDLDGEILEDTNVLPYRAGYEEEDRRAIQTALDKGELRGVVATSGLELGIDIGDISTVVLLGTPPTIQAFRQRFGRMGRRNPGVCVLVDTKGVVPSESGGLAEYLAREPEKGWLYLDNKYIQYTNALCAAAEVQSANDFKVEPYKSLPASFIRMVKNELDPTETLPQDLFPLKQRAQNGPHIEFPVRSGIEKNFSVRQRQGPNVTPLGTLSHSQMLREGFPGAVYYYMSKPYRVNSVNFRQGEIDVRRERYFTTQPIAQNMVFPKFPNGALSLIKSEFGFVAEAELQVSERVTGFVETRGNTKSPHNYGPGSPFSEKPLVRMFETTGVCWSLHEPVLMTEAIASAILEAFCLTHGIHTRDLGIGTFHSNISPLGGTTCRGICVYDATHGSLRLTQKLAENFGDVVEETVSLMKNQEDFDQNLGLNLAYLKECVSDMNSANFGVEPQVTTGTAEMPEWVQVFAVGERVIYKTGSGDVTEMFVNGHRFTPVGLMYSVKAGENGNQTWTKATEVLAADESIKIVEYNLYTGDIRKVSS